MSKNICKYDKCGIEFIPFSSRQAYCCQDCQQKANYQKRKANGYYATSKTKFIRVCSSRECGKEFETEYKVRKFCSNKCKKREAYLIRVDKGKDYYTPVEHKKKVCKYRNCNDIFQSKMDSQDFCCPKHREKEQREKAKDRRLAANPNKRTYTSHIKILKEKKKEKRFKIEKMSTKWLQDAWERVRHEYIKETA